VNTLAETEEKASVRTAKNRRARLMIDLASRARMTLEDTEGFAGPVPETIVGGPDPSLPNPLLVNRLLDGVGFRYFGYYYPGNVPQSARSGPVDTG
jgi:hypothetical protein